MKRTAFWAGVASAMLLGGAAMAETITGSVSYRERIAVPPGAVLEIEMQDTSEGTVNATRMASQRFAMTAVPFDFALQFDPALIVETDSYALSARVTVDRQLVWETADLYPVLTHGSGDSVEMLLIRVSDGGGASPLDDTEWTIVEIQGEPFESDPPSSLAFVEGGGLAAYAGCNRFRGEATIEGDRLRIGDNMAGTMMACPDPVQAGEQAMLQALIEVERFAIDGDALVLFNLNDRPVMRLRRVSEG